MEYESFIGKISLVQEKTEQEKALVNSSTKAADFARTLYNGNINLYESFYVLLLNNSCEVNAFALVSQGGITQTSVDVRLIAKYVVNTLSTSVILVHNHPSGKLEPSRSDDILTNKVVEALKLFDTKVLDHIIITETGHFSYADECKL